jgi:ankyrin repeat protein
MSRVDVWALLLVSVSSLAAPNGSVSVIQAVKDSNTAAVRSLLKNGANANAKEADGTTALHWAADRDDLAIADLLIKAGADVKAVNRYGMNPLLVACNNGSAALVERLLKAGADPNSALPEGETALMTAARAGKAEVIRALYRAGADVNAKESWHHQTALMWAAGNNNPAAIEMLKEVGADLNGRSEGGFTALLFAARDGRLEAAKMLLKLGANVNDTIQPLNVEKAAPRMGFGNGNVVEVYNRTAGARPAGPEGTSALVLAIENIHFELAKYLVEQGADANAAAQGWTPLIMLEYVRRPNHGKGLPPPESNDSLGSMELAKVLLDHGADINARQTKEIDDHQRNNQNRIGATAFFLAAKHADVPMMKFLVEHGADPLIKSQDGVTPLAVAAGVGIFNVGESAGTNEEAFEAVKLAYALGSEDVNAADDYGYTALHGAALRGSPEIVKFLVDKGADFDVKTKEEGWTPLRIADGVFYTATIKRAREAGDTLRQLMRAHGMMVADMDNTVDNGHHQIVKQ